MIEKSWRIESNYTKPLRWFRVQVHDSLLSLRRAAARYSWQPFSAFSDAMACVQQVPERWEVSQSGPDVGPLYPKSGFAGVIRLSKDHLWPEVIHHEILHAAAVVYRLNVARDIQLGTFTDSTDAEENLAYIVGQLGSDMDAKIRKWSGLSADRAVS